MVTFNPAQPSAEPVPDYAITTPAEFLRELARAGYDLTRLETRIPPHLFIAWARDPAVLDALEAVCLLAARALAVREAHARGLALSTLSRLLAESECPVESRRLATALARASQPRKPLPPPPRSPEPAPAPRSIPCPELTAAQVCERIQSALARPDDPEENTASATIAAFCDHHASLNGDPLPTHDPAAASVEIGNSLLRCCNPDLPPTVLAHAESDTAATRILSWPGETPDRTCSITLHLARAPTSRRPHCFLITALSMTLSISDPS